MSEASAGAKSGSRCIGDRDRRCAGPRARPAVAASRWRRRRRNRPTSSCVRARSNGIGTRSCSAMASSAAAVAASRSPRAANSIARHRSPAASIRARSTRRPSRSSASIGGSASPRRSSPISASTASGRNNANIRWRPAPRETRPAAVAGRSAPLRDRRAKPPGIQIEPHLSRAGCDEREFIAQLPGDLGEMCGERGGITEPESDQKAVEGNENQFAFLPASTASRVMAASSARARSSRPVNAGNSAFCTRGASHFAGRPLGPPVDRRPGRAPTSHRHAGGADHLSPGRAGPVSRLCRAPVARGCPAIRRARRRG